MASTSRTPKISLKPYIIDVKPRTQSTKSTIKLFKAQTHDTDYRSRKPPTDPYELVYCADTSELTYLPLQVIISDPRFGKEIMPKIMRVRKNKKLFRVSPYIKLKVDWPEGKYWEQEGTWREIEAKILVHASMDRGNCTSCCSETQRRRDKKEAEMVKRVKKAYEKADDHLEMHSSRRELEVKRMWWKNHPVPDKMWHGHCYIFVVQKGKGGFPVKSTGKLDGVLTWEEEDEEEDEDEVQEIVVELEKASLVNSNKDTYVPTEGPTYEEKVPRKVSAAENEAFWAQFEVS